MPDFIDSFHLSMITSPLWKYQILKYYGTKALDVISMEGNRSYQLKKYGDYIVVFEEQENIKFKTIETKTRAELIYNRYYLNDKKILFEIMGNFERRNNGSSLYDTKADIWATAFYVGDSLKEPMFFDAQSLKSYIQHWEHQGKYEYRMSNTNQQYQTRSILVSLDSIRQFLLKPF